MYVLLARSLNCAAEQVIRADRPIAFLSWCFVPRCVDAIRGRRLNSGVRQLAEGLNNAFVVF
jgi:hypothetical protein